MRVDGRRIHLIQIVADLLPADPGDLLHVFGRVPRQLALELHRLERLDPDVQRSRPGELGDVVRVLVHPGAREKVATPRSADREGGTQHQLERVSHGYLPRANG